MMGKGMKGKMGEMMKNAPPWAKGAAPAKKKPKAKAKPKGKGGKKPAGY